MQVSLFLFQAKRAMKILCGACKELVPVTETICVSRCSLRFTSL
jgi:uncharacterized CHY-type Zn-finger protein